MDINGLLWSPYSHKTASSRGEARKAGAPHPDGSSETDNHCLMVVYGCFQDTLPVKHIESARGVLPRAVPGRFLHGEARQPR
jgi:hypothetical protein